MQRWKQAAGCVAVVAGLMAGSQASAAQPAAANGACDLPESVRDAFERRHAQGPLTRA